MFIYIHFICSIQGLVLTSDSIQAAEYMNCFQRMNSGDEGLVTARPTYSPFSI